MRYIEFKCSKRNIKIKCMLHKMKFPTLQMRK